MIQMDLQGQNLQLQEETTPMPMKMETTPGIAQMEAPVYCLIFLLTKPTQTQIKARMLLLQIYFTGIISSMMWCTNTVLMKLLEIFKKITTEMGAQAVTM